MRRVDFVGVFLDDGGDVARVVWPFEGRPMSGAHVLAGVFSCETQGDLGLYGRLYCLVGCILITNSSVAFELNADVQNTVYKRFFGFSDVFQKWAAAATQAYETFSIHQVLEYLRT